ncbi:autophagy associated beclin family protein Atg6 [Schizosaccharomyces osmophilus]|uniref:Autophagy associated beclin family protein Atg6 n=1 Tax=Schizosaccharomyces osmophilus TaxID=2545709 RepID=A0AAE9W6L8_9SCHI|nr:autophagy associated beclin family protein Atg6 [Schizosaccharomyces osmophilus]WBW70859.1 autophagy associated beclin family protein Atg6 [Schizosaccharomyces osmophilus]
MHFVCQKCHSLLKLKENYDDELVKQKLFPKSVSLWTPSLTETNEECESDDETASSVEDYPVERLQLYKKALKEGESDFPQSPQTELKTPTLDSFVVLPASHDGYNENEDERNPSTEVNDLFSWKIENYYRIFDLLSAKTKVNHPLCEECAELLAEEMTKTLNSTKAEKNLYSYYSNMLANQDFEEEDISQFEADVQEISEKIKEKEKAIVDLSAQEQELQSHFRDMIIECEKTNVEENEYKKTLNQLLMKESALEKQRDCAQLEFEHNSKKFEKLQKMNVFSDIFYISHYSEPNGEGSIATINGLRLGRLPSQKVSWSEINAAWGMTVLLLDVLAERLDFHSPLYQLKPFGSQSYILRYDQDLSTGNTKPVRIDLFSTGELKIFMNRRFDQGMVAFLDYLHQLGDFCAANTPSAILPYPIENDRIGSKCIRLAFNQDENWTRALKFVLTNIKFLEAYVSSQEKHTNF